MKTSEIIKNSKISRLEYYRNGVFHYITDNDFKFQIPLEDVDGVTLNAIDKTIYFMRWIRKCNEMEIV